MAKSVEPGDNIRNGTSINDDSHKEKQQFVSDEKAKEFVEKELQLKKRESELLEMQRTLETEKENLRKREKAVQEAEIKRDQGYADEHKKLNDEIFDRRRRLEKELSGKHSKGLEEISQELSKQMDMLFQSLEKEISEKRAAADAVIAKETQEIEIQKAEIKKAEKDIISKSSALNTREDVIKVRAEEYNRGFQTIEDEVERRTAETKKSFDAEKSRLEEECSKLRDELTRTERLVDLFETLKQKLGEEPEIVWQKLKAYEEQIRHLKQELLNRPTKEMQDAIDGIKKEKEYLEQACNRLRLLLKITTTHNFSIMLQ
jgi:chromosome segregation ATPase